MSWFGRGVSVLVLAGLVCGGAAAQSTRAQTLATQKLTPTGQKLTPVVGYAVYNDTSPALRDLIEQAPEQAAPEQQITARPMLRLEVPKGENPQGVDAALQTQEYPQTMPGFSANFEGITNPQGYVPPDTNGDIGYDPANDKKYYFQTVNVSFRFWDVSDLSNPSPITPVTSNNSLWKGAGGSCESHNDGDVVGVFDAMAHRWILSQFAFNLPNGPYYQCIAISASADPLGAWYRYSFLAPNNEMNDYPKIGVWPDAYYMTDNQFLHGDTWDGGGVFAFDRAKMLEGLPAAFIYFNLKDISSWLGGHLPAGFNGLYAPPLGAPGLFMELDQGIPDDAGASWMRIWEFHADFANPANSTFGSSTSGDWALANYKLSVDPFVLLPNNSGHIVPQKDTNQLLDVIGDRLMYRLAYRNMGTRQVLVVNQSVDAGGGRAGIRWYEVQDSGSGWNIRQQGTWAPADGSYRWMGSMASDAKGNLALGYSISSSSMYPSINIAGRLANDPPGKLTQGEATLVAGGGSQTSASDRWGDYSSMSIDPVDDCTFWYTTEYYAATSVYAWHTRIGAFSFPGCGKPATGTLTGAVSNSNGGAAIQGASVSAGPQLTVSGADGHYALALPTGVYTVTVKANGFLPQSITNVVISSGSTVTKNFSLAQRNAASVHGVVKDGSGHGYGLYARLDIASMGYQASVFSDPVSGAYQVSLYQGQEYTIKVSGAGLAGYLAQQATVTPAAASVGRNFSLLVDTGCSAPGYSSASGGCKPIPGGLATGFVTDQNTGSGMIDATLTSDTGWTTSFATPDDAAQGDGMYVFFQATVTNTIPETHTLGAGVYGGYLWDVQAVRYQPNAVVTQDFALLAGRFAIAPSAFEVSVATGQTVTRTLTITNTGTAQGYFTFRKLPLAMPGLGSFDAPRYTVKPFKQSFRSAADLPLPPAPDYPDLSAGEVISTWSSGLPSAWGIAPEASGKVWVSSPAAAWGGDNSLHAFTTTGTPTGETQAYTWNPLYGPADLAFNPHSGSFWTVSVGEEDNCIYELQPEAGFTGGRICPGGGSGFAAAGAVAQRGLAYDPATDTFYAGSWNDMSIQQFRPDGTLLRRRNVGLAISGLAYNPDTRHLFAMVSAEVTKIYVLDAAHDFEAVGAFTIGSGLGAYSGAGLEMGCDGSLWLVDQSNGRVYNVSSGEKTTACEAEAAWFDINPYNGYLGPGDHEAVVVTFYTRGFAPGTYNGQIQVDENTPYDIPNLPVTLHNEGAAVFLPEIRKGQ
jgi:hypothetical protein